VLAAAVPAARLAYHSAELHLGVECVMAAIATVAGVIAIGHARRATDSTALLIAAAISAGAVGTWCFGVVPAALGAPGFEAKLAWGQVAATLFAAVALVLAGTLPTFAVGRTFITKLSVGAPIAAAVAATTAAALVNGRIQVTTVAGALHVHASIGLLAAQILTAALYLVAAAAFFARAQRASTPFCAQLATGLLLLAASRLAFFGFPSLYVDWVSAGDAIRLAGFAVFLGALVAEMQRESHEVAVTRERERIAGEIHGGLAQELSLLLLTLGRSGGDAERRQEVEVARRAFESSRAVIQRLSAH
jgi:signal transduction histidine kinase